MRALYFPAAILAAILGLSLWTGRYIRQQTDRWVAQLETVEAAAEQETWGETQRRLQQAYEDWDRSQVLLHTIMEHDQLDEAEAYFAGARASCDRQDRENFSVMLAQLTGKLQQLAETQSASIKNIL